MGFSRTRVAYTAGEAIGPELFQLLPLARHQPEAALRADRGQRLHHAAAGRRGLSRHRRQAGARTWRSKSPTAARCCSRARACSSSITRTTRPPARPRRRTAGCIRAMPASSTSAGISRSSIAPRTSGRLNNGALFAPKYLENRIKFYPEVREAVAFGQGRDYVTMFINIDLDLGRQLGRAQQRLLRQLSGAGRASAGSGDRRQARGRAQQGAGRRAADGGLADPPLPHPAQGARRRRRRADPHAEGAPLASSPIATRRSSPRSTTAPRIATSPSR